MPTMSARVRQAVRQSGATFTPRVAAGTSCAPTPVGGSAVMPTAAGSGAVRRDAATASIRTTTAAVRENLTGRQIPFRSVGLLDGKVIAVTGAGRGIGRAVALAAPPEAASATVTTNGDA